MPHAPVKKVSSFQEAVDVATSVQVLHSRLEERPSRRKSQADTSRYRVNTDCDEQGKSFITIEVLPHFL